MLLKTKNLLICKFGNYKGVVMEYQKQLLKRLLKMIEANEKEREYYKSATNKLPKQDLWNKEFNRLSEKEQRACWNGGQLYSKSAFKRVRIELNKAMIEWENGE